MKKTKLILSVCLGVSLVCGWSVSIASTGITYQGRIIKPNGEALEGRSVRFKMSIYSPISSNCLLYQETQAAIDMRDSNGLFSITMNGSGSTRTDASGYSISEVFDNRQTFTLPANYCNSGTTYVSAVGDERRLSVSFKDETMTSWEQIPVQIINYVPMAIEATQVGGFSSKNLLRFAEADGTLVNTSPLDNDAYTELLALLAGTSNLYEKAGRLKGVSIPTLTAGQVLSWDGSSWDAIDPIAGVQAFAKAALPTCAAGEFLRNNGSNAFECIGVSGVAGGTVTQVDTGTGLTGGGFTTTGTISIAAGGVGTTELADDAVNSAKIDDGTITGSDLATNIAITTT
ncbi:MAG TPA: hypothetical protein VM432_08905, partial [Bdellovibrionales bacterium]|nr:hypothetical protein [Bdellovibrionales bacterium]